jgi:hypothetical protein
MVRSSAVENPGMANYDKMDSNKKVVSGRAAASQLWAPIGVWRSKTVVLFLMSSTCSTPCPLFAESVHGAMYGCQRRASPPSHKPLCRRLPLSLAGHASFDNGLGTLLICSVLDDPAYTTCDVRWHESAQAVCNVSPRAIRHMEEIGKRFTG